MLSLDNPQDLWKIRERLGRLSAAGGSLPPAVVAGTSINALGVVRALAAERIPVVWLTSNPHSFVNYSRFSSCNIACRDAFYDGFVPALLELGSMFSEPPVLFLTHDFQVQRVCDARRELSLYYRLGLPSSDVTKWMLLKNEFRAIAMNSGLPTPPTVCVLDQNGLTEFLTTRDKTGSWVIKPIEKSDAFESVFGKAIRIDSDKDWRSFVQKYRSINVPVLIQPWIAGPDSNVVFCLVVFDGQSNCLMSFCGRKIRQFKPDVGNTASAERYFIKDIQDTTIAFFQRWKFVGLGSLEFKYNTETRNFYAIEPTVGRTDLQSEVASINGCNLSAIHYFSTLGEQKKIIELIDRARYSKKNRIWVRFGADLKASWYYYKRKRMTAIEFIRSVSRPTSYALFRLNDPFPFMLFLWRVTYSATKDLVKVVVFRWVWRGRNVVRRGRKVESQVREG